MEPHEIAEARQAAEAAEELIAKVGRYTMPPVSDEAQAPYRIPRRTGGVLPSPGREAAKAREEVAALAKRLGQLEGYCSVRAEETRKLIQVMEDLQNRVGELDRFQEGIASAVSSLRTRVEALECSPAINPDDSRSRILAFLRALEGCPLPARVFGEWKALLELLK